MGWRRTNHDFNDEIQAHIALETDRLVNEGMSPEEARAAAIRGFGNVASAEERFYESRRALCLDRLMADCRFALRSMSNYPTVCLVAIVSLAAGIGCATATLTLRNAMFFNPPPLYQSPEELSFIGVVTPEDRTRQGIPAGLYFQFAGTDQFQGVAAATVLPRITDVRTSDGEDSVNVRAIMPDLFSVLGVAPTLGRTFSPTGEGEAVIAYRTWQQTFHGRTDVIGSTVWIDNEAKTVVGVMPERFWFSEMEPAIWTSMVSNPIRRGELLEVIGRRATGVTSAALEEAFQAFVDRYASTLPETQRNIRARVFPVAGTPVAYQIAPPVVILFGLCVALTLLISCANVGVLMTAQWTSREREIAIRSSLGASRGRVIRMLLTESVLVALMGGVLGICLTFVFRSLLLRHGPIDIALYNFAIDSGVLLRTTAIAAGAGILIGLAPAIYETQSLQANPLRSLRSDRSRQRWRHALVVVEITVTIALLVVTSIMIDAYRRNFSMSLGFSADRLLVAFVNSPTGVRPFELVERLQNLPEVEAAAVSTAVPIFSAGERQSISIAQSGEGAFAANRIFIDPGFFDALNVPIREGRSFVRNEIPNAVIVNGLLANRLWPQLNPLGKSIWNSNKRYQVVGVVAAYSSMLLRRPGANFYLPLSDKESAELPLQFLVRSRGDPASLIKAMRSEARELSGFRAQVDVVPLRAIVNQNGYEILTLVYPMTVLIVIGTLLTATGIYSILAFSVSRRSKELAVRLAVGATHRDLLRLVAKHSLKLVSTGIVLGIGATFALSRLAQGQGGVFDSPGAAVFVIPVIIILLVTTLAAWMPARRAMMANPATLLRSE